LKSYQPDDIRLERAVFQHISKPYLLVADACYGKEIKTCTFDFLYGLAGALFDSIQINNKIYGIGKHAELFAYIGHNGLMGFLIEDEISFHNRDGKERSTIILACISKAYFSAYLDHQYVNPALWTTGLMAPEAYTLHDALKAYLDGKSNEEIRVKAAEAYHKYQRCGLNAAKRLLVTGY
jgi:hypothetical protein